MKKCRIGTCFLQDLFSSTHETIKKGSLPNFLATDTMCLFQNSTLKTPINKDNALIFVEILKRLPP